MIPCLKMRNGEFMPLQGNPALVSLDGERRAPLRVLLSPSWTAEQRAEFGVYLLTEEELRPKPTPERLQEMVVDIFNYARDIGRVAVLGLPHPVIFHSEDIQIGMERRTIEGWDRVPGTFGNFWRDNREALLAIAKMKG